MGPTKKHYIIAGVCVAAIGAGAGIPLAIKKPWEHQDSSSSSSSSPQSSDSTPGTDPYINNPYYQPPGSVPPGGSGGGSNNQNPILSPGLNPGSGSTPGTGSGSSSDSGSGSGSGSGGDPKAIHGQMTYYTPGLGACGVTNTESDHICAIGHDLYDAHNIGNPNNNPLCGHKIRATHNGKSLVLTVEDRCEACTPGDIDLTPGAFQELEDLKEGRVAVTWVWLDPKPEGV